MALKTTLQKAALAAFNAINDLLVECRYIQVVGHDDYDPATDTNQQDEVHHTGIKFLFEDYSLQELQNSAVQAGDQKATTLQGFLPIKSEPGDKIVDADDLTWRVIRVTKDPADVLWILQVRHGE